jgi:hypothetical protein
VTVARRSNAVYLPGGGCVPRRLGDPDEASRADAARLGLAWGPLKVTTLDGSPSRGAGDDHHSFWLGLQWQHPERLGDERPCAALAAAG